MTKPELKVLPIQFLYKDKIDLAYKLLNIYSVMVEPLTKRNISLLSMCLLDDMNGDDFQKTVIKSKIGITNENQFRQEMHRLKEKNLIIKHNIVNRKDLCPRLQKIKDLIDNDNGKMGVYLEFNIFN